MILGFVVEVIATVLFGRWASGAGTDRHLLTQGRVRSGLRALEGRVLNMGTEWSTGVCEISQNHLRFVPSVGIVGKRDIDVTGARVTTNELSAQVTLFNTPPVTLVVSTARGELLWAIPERVAGQALALLGPRS